MAASMRISGSSESHNHQFSEQRTANLAIPHTAVSTVELAPEPGDTVGATRAGASNGVGNGPPVRSRLRFTIAVSAGIVVAAVPYLWVLWDLWTGTVDTLRTAPVAGDFYDLQARSMMHGHLAVPTNSIGPEAFLHNGRQYTYFGLFPSLLRIPVFLLTSSLDGRLTAPSILLAWSVTALFSALLLWRVRTIGRGSAPLGGVEAISYGVVMAAILAGSVIVMLAATPYVYDEDFAWSIALTVGALFALLGVMERPTGCRVALAGLLVMGGVLNRAPTGWACAIGAVLVAVWFYLGRHGAHNRRWAGPMLAVGLLPLAVAGLINLAKFGSPIGFSLTNQLYTLENAHRRYYLSTTGGKGYSIRFIPSTLLAYFGPAGIRFTPVFPFITMPAAPAAAVGGVVLEWQYRTYSVTASMPLFLLLSIAGVVTSLRRRVGRMGLTRIPLFTALIGAAGVAVWGYLAARYIGDFLPFLIIASFVGLIDLWRRAHGRSRRIRFSLLGAVVILGVYGIVVNVASASTPNNDWNRAQTLRYVQAQKSVSDGTGHPLVQNIERGAQLPLWAPADQLFIVGDCQALYISNGMDYSHNSPQQAYEHASWNAVQYGAHIVYDVSLTLRAPTAQMKGHVPIVTVGHDTIWMKTIGTNQVRFGVDDPRGTTTGPPADMVPNFVYPFELDVDPYLRWLTWRTFGNTFLSAEWPNGPSQPVTAAQPATGGYPFSAVVSEPVQDAGLCRSLLSESQGSGAADSLRARSSR